MHVHQTRGAEFRRPAREGGGEGSLVVIVAVVRRGILTAYVDDGVACGEESRIAGTEQRAGVVGGEEAEEVDC